MAGEEPKLIIDTDWKSQAQAEKERLAQQSAAAKAAAAPGSKEGELPHEVKFEDLAGLLATQAMQFLGYFPDPQTGQAIVSLEYAKLHIDMLEVLEEKTKGNLTEQEQKYLQRILTQLRMDFVEMSKAVAKAVQEGRVRPAGAATTPGVVTPGVVTPNTPPTPPGIPTP
jgi:hypothetical protein